MYSASQLADWWESNRKESEQALNDFVDAHPNWWALAATTQTAMDVGAMFVDVLRFGEGAAESYTTGKISPLIQDVFRGLTVATGSAKVFQKARPMAGKLMGLYADMGGNTCQAMSIQNAARLTGRRLLLSLEEIARGMGIRLSVLEAAGASDAQMLAALERLKIPHTDLGRMGSFQDLLRRVPQGEGLVTVPLSDVAGGAGHMTLLERTAAGYRIVDRSGFYNTLDDLIRAYGGNLEFDSTGAVVLFRTVTAKLLHGVPTLMVYSNGLFAHLTGDKSIPQLDQEFQAFKAQQAGKGTQQAAGSRTITVAPGDTLSGLAMKYYGALEYWPLLWDANRGVVGPDPNRITRGMQLQIPPFASFSQAQLQDARRRHPSWRSYGAGR
jgi:hypothetical protein